MHALGSCQRRLGFIAEREDGGIDAQFEGVGGGGGVVGVGILDARGIEREVDGSPQRSSTRRGLSKIDDATTLERCHHVV